MKTSQIYLRQLLPSSILWPFCWRLCFTCGNIHIDSQENVFTQPFQMLFSSMVTLAFVLWFLPKKYSYSSRDYKTGVSGFVVTMHLGSSMHPGTVRTHPHAYRQHIPQTGFNPIEVCTSTRRPNVTFKTFTNCLPNTCFCLIFTALYTSDTINAHHTSYNQIWKFAL